MYNSSFLEQNGSEPDSWYYVFYQAGNWLNVSFLNHVNLPIFIMTVFQKPSYLFSYLSPLYCLIVGREGGTMSLLPCFRERRWVDKKNDSVSHPWSESEKVIQVGCQGTS